jgi:hypothetical protein
VLLPTPQEYGQLIDAALEYYDAVGSEEAAEMVLRADDAPVNMYEDINPELIGAIDAFGDDEEGFSREGQFVERILELGRVTKVGHASHVCCCQAGFCFCVRAVCDLASSF